jgi:PAS domain S-box-containing protein
MALRLFERMRALAADERRFRSVFENTSMVNTLCEVVRDRAGNPVDYRFIAANAAFERLVGLKAADLVGRTLRELFPRTEAVWLDTFAEVARSGVETRVEDYSVELGIITELNVFAPQEGLLALSSTDVTTRRKAEDAVRKSEEKHRLLVEKSHDIIYTLDANGVFTYASPAWRTLLGHRTEDVVGRSFRDFIHPDDVEAIRAWMGRVVEFGPGTEGIEYRVRHADGSWHWHTSSAVVLRDGSGAITGYEGTARDISDRKAVEEALHEKSTELDRYFSSALDLLCIADTGGHFLRLNPQWEKVLGYALPELEGRLFLDFVHPDDLEATLAALGRLRTQEEVLSFENRYRCKDGSYRWIEWRSHPQGETIYAAARDVTDRKLAEDRVRSLLGEKETLLREVHHRIKNNMNTMTALLSLQAQALEDDKAREALEDAGRRIRSMKVLYERIYQSPDYHSMSVAEYLPAMAEEIVSNFPNSRMVTLNAEVADFSLEARVLQPLGIIVNELLTNCMKHAFNDRNAGTIGLSANRTGGMVTVVVEDDGIGTPPDIDICSSPGFGLSLVKELAAQLKGKARLERGPGTRVVLEFPG